jgi:hypothetical protein
LGTPVDAFLMPDGALLIPIDTAGAIYREIPPPPAGPHRPGLIIFQIKTNSPFLSRINPLPSIDDSMFCGLTLSSLAFTWP